MRAPTRSAAEAEKGYRRGIVLGLTMAETMLLLLFCLMLASAAILVRKDQAIAQLTAKAVTTGFKFDASIPQVLAGKLIALKLDPAEVKALEEILDERSKSAEASPTAISEFWKELVEAADVAKEMKQHQITLAEARDALESYEAAEAASGEGKRHDWPPIIRLSDADGYSFDIGSAQLKPGFGRALRTDIAGRLAELIAEYDVDVIEVIGHTDEQRVWLTGANFDDEALPTLRGEDAIEALIPGDNASLGLARAISVTNILRRDPRLAKVRVLPLSAGQLIMPGDIISDGSQAGDVPQRRRIEIRLRRHADIDSAAQN